ncbi:MAG TPA: septal ring lytic transglycosylase RlpA family protein [Spirochaetes bacterium]|nr:septal ring lytic transglycosylase RlpA family protein [Spirochaetota bacterium]
MENLYGSGALPYHPADNESAPRVKQVFPHSSRSAEKACPGHGRISGNYVFSAPVVVPIIPVEQYSGGFINMKKILSGAAIIAMAFGLSGAVISCAPNRALTRDQLMGSRKQAPAANEKEYTYTYDDRDGRGDIYNGGTEKPVRDRQAKSERADDDFIEYGKVDKVEAPVKETYYQTGMASWYGREFHGRMTASGERFDMNELTAAHRTLPFGTVVEVRNLDTGKSVRVTINDRGPYKKNRIIDLSHAAARRLDILADGEAMVGIKLSGKSRGNVERGRSGKDTVEPVSGLRIKEDEGGREDARGDEYASDENPRGRYAVQAGAFYSKRKAEALGKQIEDIVGQPVVIIQENLMYKVRVPGIESKAAASRMRSQLKKKNINSFIRDSRE